jgi:hypothetical protein
MNASHMTPTTRFLLLVFFCLMVPIAPAMAQQTSGSISGVVQDKQGAVIPKAAVALVDQQQGARFTRETNEAGLFVFTPLKPSTYTLSVTVTGFKAYAQTNITLDANDRLALPAIVLEVGALSEKITVEASTGQLQTQSAERSGVITGTQVQNLALNGRNWYDLMKLVPGDISLGDWSSTVNGGRGDQNIVFVDGLTTIDSGNNGLGAKASLDVIAEYKVITNAQQAEFGRAIGGTVSIVTKSGTKDFHGSGYLFHRNEGLNANTWRNNAGGLQKGLYRYNQAGFTAGGPIYIPHKFNSNKDKLFIFVGGEYLRQLALPLLKTVTVPTAAERTGDFSATRDAGGRAVTIKDPLTGLPFPGNIVPANRMNPDGPKILSFFPLPNVTGQPSYNYQEQAGNRTPLNQYLVRGDWNISPKWRVYSRYLGYGQNGWAPYSSSGIDVNFTIGKGFTNLSRGRAVSVNVTTIISPTMTNELIVGRTTNEYDASALDNAYSMAAAGLTLKELYPGADPAQEFPNFTFGNISNPPSVNFSSTQPYLSRNPTIDVTDNLAKVANRHTFKFGIYFDKTAKDQSNSIRVTPTIDFTPDTSNPGDTGWAYSNALLGNYRSYTQTQQGFVFQLRFENVEWYAQDSWKVSKTLSLDYGLRFCYVQPQHDAQLRMSGFNPGLWNSAQAVSLYQQALNASGASAALNPLNGQLSPALLIGAIVPNSGNLINGIGVEGTNGYPLGLINSRGINYGPRFGLAWNPRGGKTVIRLGGGIFYERLSGNLVSSSVSNPPAVLTGQVFYGNLATVSQSAPYYFPVSLGPGSDKAGQIPTSNNFNLTVQRKLPGQVMLDVAYVGMLGRHLTSTTNLNNPGFGSAWLPQNQDPTVKTPKYDGTTTKQVNFTRPYPGYGIIQIRNFGTSNNYNGVQISVNRRLSHGLELHAHYVHSKALGISGASGGLQINPLNSRKADYGPLNAIDRPDNFVLSYTYDVPSLARRGSFLDHPVSRLVFNGWQVSGITSFTSGAPSAISYSVSGIGAAQLNRMITGDESWAPRVVITGNPNLARGDRTVGRWINGTVFAPAVKGSTGMDSAAYPARNPGVNNWDISVFKNIAYSKETGRRIQLRVEMFNAFNHPEWSAWNSAVLFNAAGQITNLASAQGGTGGTFGFGAITNTTAARVIQLAVKLNF